MNTASTLTIKFKFTKLNNSYMQILVDHNNDLTTILPSDSDECQYVKDITLPTTLKLTFLGKDLTKDTIVDDQCNIIQDKCVIIEQMTMDNIAVEPLYLKRRLKLDYNNGQVNYSNYIGFNGTMVIDFTKNNTFNQLMHFKYLGEIEE